MIWTIVAAILSWAAAILMLTGRGSFLISGYNTSGKDGRALAQKEYDIRGITRYLGKMILLPLAIITSVLLIIGLTGLIDLDNMTVIGSPGLSIFIGLVASFGIFGYVMFVHVQITSGRFTRK